MSAYSFLDVTMTIDGEGGNFSIREGSTDEGVSVEPVGDRNTLTAGADGSGMHSLNASTASTVTLRLLKTSPVNAKLMAMFTYQSASAARWGRNTIQIEDTARGDLIVVSDAAFKKEPPLNYAKEGGLVEWQFDGIATKRVLGSETRVDES